MVSAAAHARRDSMALESRRRRRRPQLHDVGDVGVSRRLDADTSVSSLSLSLSSLSLFSSLSPATKS